jgi:hypothetical protein
MLTKLLSASDCTWTAWKGWSQITTPKDGGIFVDYNKIALAVQVCEHIHLRFGFLLFTDLLPGLLPGCCLPGLLPGLLPD